MKAIIVFMIFLSVLTSCDNAPEAVSAVIDDGKLLSSTAVRPIDLLQGYWTSSDNQANHVEIRQRSWLDLRHGDPVGTKSVTIVLDCDNPIQDDLGTSLILRDNIGTSCFNIDQLSAEVLIFREDRSGIAARYERS